MMFYFLNKEHLKQGEYRRHFGRSLPSEFPTNSLEVVFKPFLFSCIGIYDVFFFCSSLADLVNIPYKFIVKQKFKVDYLRAEEGLKESQKTKRKVYDFYARKDLCEDPTKLKKLRVPRLDK